ncbi:hypothetical protein GPLA_1181 [Paraglaciecola polaris LMG 21857]|uniref:Uncharacterized protein n=1 Tax=Paraglaciecola polaris LMG 21857 TaxID=1129793 RepID=K6Z7B5_9ALTE|nr:hypothetical protein GPLA_1181 [Paraglaciecola polaris LMG 21857]
MFIDILYNLDNKNTVTQAGLISKNTLFFSDIIVHRLLP